ncbi:hypothetical protein LWI28_009347 [Acer negundo]|uniref:Uncharacterized protein n=1 Tax=Acer negundo TaxID=4023 RepID=A0AAD5ITQ8_ACENE|nr:hypothetical protein LWI28_009347 [Acer negundo]
MSSSGQGGPKKRYIPKEVPIEIPSKVATKRMKVKSSFHKGSVPISVNSSLNSTSEHQTPPPTPHASQMPPVVMVGSSSLGTKKTTPAQDPHPQAEERAQQEAKHKYLVSLTNEWSRYMSFQEVEKVQMLSLEEAISTGLSHNFKAVCSALDWQERMQALQVDNKILFGHLGQTIERNFKLQGQLDEERAFSARLKEQIVTLKATVIEAKSRAATTLGDFGLGDCFEIRALKKMGRRKKLKKELICEDWCFICKDGGSLRICDYKDCLKAYHPECVGKNDSMLENEDIWACNWHYCFLCNKVSKFYCYCCPFSVCGRCLHNAEFTLVRRDKGFCNDCLELTLLIEENRDVDSNGNKIDFNDQDTLEFLFKEYWLLTKKKEGFTSEEIISTYNLLKSGKKCNHDYDSFEYNEGEEEISEFEDGKQLIMSDYDEYLNDSEEHMQVGRRKRSKRKLSVVKRDFSSKKKEFIGWGSKPLMEFLTSIGKDTNHELSEYDIATIIIEYCKENKLFHPERNKKIICDSRLQPLFRRKSVNKNGIHNLLSAHLAENMDHSEDELGCYLQTLDEDVLVAGKKHQHASSSVKRHDQSEKEVVEVKKSCFASVVLKNIKLVYLKRSLVAELSKQLENFDDKVMGSLVRVKADPNDYCKKILISLCK